MKAGPEEPSTARIKKVLFVGRLAPRKGVKEFVQRSLPAIVQQIPRVQFVIAGDNPAHSLTHAGDLKQDLLAEIAKLNLSDHVRFMGAVDDETLAGLYRECDVVVLPVLSSKSDVEGFGIVLIEAAAAGKPVVATRAGGIPDAVEDGATGFLVEAGDYTAFTEALNKLLSDPLLALEMGTRGQSRINVRNLPGAALSRAMQPYSRRRSGKMRWSRISEKCRSRMSIAGADSLEKFSQAPSRIAPQRRFDVHRYFAFKLESRRSSQTSRVAGCVEAFRVSLQQLIHRADIRGNHWYAAGDDLIGFLREADFALRRVAIADDCHVEGIDENRHFFVRQLIEIVDPAALRKFQITFARSRQCQMKLFPAAELLEGFEEGFDAAAPV